MILTPADDLEKDQRYYIHWTGYDGQECCQLGIFSHMTVEYGAIWLWFTTVDGLEYCYPYHEAVFSTA